MTRSLVPRRTGLLFLSAHLSMVALVVLSAGAVSAYTSSTHWVQRTLEVRQSLYEWLSTVVDAETGARGYLATGKPFFLEPYDAALARETVLTATMRGLVADNATEIQGLDVAESDARAALRDLGELVALTRAGHRADAIARLASGTNKTLMDRFRVDARRIEEEEDRLLAQRREVARWREWAALVGTALITLAAGALLALAWKREERHERKVSDIGTEARSRLEALSQLAAALSEVRTRSQVADVIVAHAMRASGSDTCTLYQIDDSGAVLDLIGDSGVAPDVLDKIRRITATSGNPATFAAMKSGTTTWAESGVDYVELYPDLATMKAEGRRARAFWSVPLIAEGRSLGLLGAGFYDARKFSPDERAFVETLASHCAQALLRASRLEREDDARRWLATTLRSIGDAVIATDAEGRVTFMNPVSETLTGWTEADARGRALEDVFSIFSEVTGDAVESPVAKVLREGTVVGLANHTVLRPKGGVQIPIDDSGAPILSEDGRMLGVVLVFRDATLEKRERARNEFLAKAGEALVSSIDYPSTLATVAAFAVPTLADWCSVELLTPGAKSSKQVAVAHVDPDKVRFARELGERYPPDPTAVTGVPQVIRSGKSELYTDIPQPMLEAGARDAEHLRIIRDLSLRSAMVVPLRVRERIFGAMTFVYAESGRRYTEDDLRFAEDFARRAAMAIENAVALKEMDESRGRERALRNEAELASQAKDEFLATISHELRTPLNAILGWTVMLRRKELAGDLDRGLAVVERNARLQTKLVEDVLDVSRIISGKLVLHLGTTNLAEAVSAAAETIAPAAAAKNIEMELDVADAVFSITADAARLQQIVWNLLSNAVKFTPKGGQVKARAYREGSEVCISVRDTGEGIRRDVLPLVFDRFQQADASITRRHGGLGLGLAIVKQLVTAHGGTVHAESDGEGRGATFVVCLPARSVVPAVNLDRPSLTSAGASVGGASTAAPRLDGLLLLVVDDEEDARTLVAEVLRGQGAEVHLAASGFEALEMVGRVRPDLVVSDVGMPEMDGLTLMRKIRALPPEQGGRTPAIALTAYARAEDAQLAFGAGYQVHVTKPVDPPHLAAVVANLGGLRVDRG